MTAMVEREVPCFTANLDLAPQPHNAARHLDTTDRRRLSRTDLPKDRSVSHPIYRKTLSTREPSCSSKAKLAKISSWATCALMCLSDAGHNCFELRGVCVCFQASGHQNDEGFVALSGSHYYTVSRLDGGCLVSCLR